VSLYTTIHLLKLLLTQHSFTHQNLEPLHHCVLEPRHLPVLSIETANYRHAKKVVFLRKRILSMESISHSGQAQVKQILRKMEFLETENNKLRSEIHTLSTRVSEVEGDNLSLKKMLHETKSRKFSILQMVRCMQKFLTLKASRKKSDPNKPPSNKKLRHTSILGYRWFEGRIKLLPLLQQLRRWCKQNLWKNATDGQEN
jgi:predicted house-cleaning noncanonical NTP pyrophosphatase (MazG superfamily)